MKLTNKILSFLVMAMFIAIPGFAQTGNVHGKVVDTDGKPLTGVTISIDRQGITQHFEVKTDNKGQFLHAGLPTGQYQISVMKDGKTKSMTLPATVRFGGDAAVDFDLKQAAAQGVSDEQRQKAAEEKAKSEATKASFEQARAALVAKNYDEAIRLFKDASEKRPTLSRKPSSTTRKWLRLTISSAFPTSASRIRFPMRFRHLKNSNSWSPRCPKSSKLRSQTMWKPPSS